MTEQSQIATETPMSAAGRADRQYDMRRLSYAGTFKNPWKAGTIRALEWLTAKIQLLRLIRSFEKSGAPHGAPFWPKAIRHMGIRIDTPAEEIARIPATGPLVVVCRSGGRSSKAATKLATAGLAVHNLSGGMTAWQKAGHPVLRDDGTPGTVI